jgi:ribosomal subunit interface protein
MDVDVITRGPVAPEIADLARDKVGELDSAVQRPLTRARVVLQKEANPRIALSARAEGQVRFDGHVVRGRVEAESMRQAVDDLAERLRRQLRRHVDRLVTRRRVPAGVTEGQWQRAAWTPARPPRSWRAPGGREVIRRKTFALEPIGAVEAAADMVALDHEFYLFLDADTRTDSVVYRRDDGRPAVIAPPGSAVPDEGDQDPLRETSRYSEPLDFADAVSEMDALNHRFLFFTDASTGRGAVLYLRYDGHYGFIEPAA